MIIFLEVIVFVFLKTSKSSLELNWCKPEDGGKAEKEGVESGFDVSLGTSRKTINQNGGKKKKKREKKVYTWWSRKK